MTLLGEGGCGKTRLALRVAADLLDRFVDGVWFVDLAALSPGADVTSRVAEVLGVHGGLDELASSARAAGSAARPRQLRARGRVHGDAGDELLSRCATTTVMATSRAPLDVAGEARYHVPPLEVPRRGADLREAQATDAVQLFTTRAGLVRPGFQLGERDAEAIVELCTRLDGLPLAIELAAARLRGMSLAELVARFDDRFGVLVGGPRTAPERHQTLRNTIEWSFRLLDRRRAARAVSPRRVPRRLRRGERRGGVRRQASRRRARVLDVLIRLVDKSLVTAVEADAGDALRPP